MLHPTDAALPRSLARERLYADVVPSLGWGPDVVEQLLRHRPPMRLVDGIDAIDLDQRRIRGHRTVDATDPVLAGHFPGEPVYPGVLQLEMIGQIGLCLAPFLVSGRVALPASPVDARVIRVHHAAFFEAVRPEDRLSLEAQVVEDSPLTAVIAGQVCRGAAICSTCILEVYLV